MAATATATTTTTTTTITNESQLLAEAIAQEERNFCGGTDAVAKYQTVCEKFIELFELSDFADVFREGYDINDATTGAAASTTMTMTTTTIAAAATNGNNIEYKTKLKKLICLLNSVYNVKVETFVFWDYGSIDTKDWGNVLWSFFHLASVLAQYYHAKTGDFAPIDYFVTSLYHVDEILPCVKCRAHYLTVKSGSQVLRIVRTLSFGLLVAGTFQFHRLISENIESQRYGTRRHSIYDMSQYNMLDFAVDWNCWPVVSTPQLSYSNEFLRLQPVFHCSNFFRLSLLLTLLTPLIPLPPSSLSDSASSTIATSTERDNSNELFDQFEFAGYSVLRYFSCVEYGNFITKCIDGIQQQQQTSPSSQQQQQQQQQQQLNNEESRYAALFTREQALTFVLALIRRNLLYETLRAGRPPRSWPTVKRPFESRREFRYLCRNWLEAMRMRDMFGLPNSYSIELDDGTRISVINHVTGDYDDYDEHDVSHTAPSSSNFITDANAYNK